MKYKIVIIGDSFATKFNNHTKIGEKDTFWIDELMSYFSTYDVICDAKGGRDAQTIIDNWIKVIPNLHEKDILIIFLPHMSRTRFSLAESEYSNVISKDETIKLINRFSSPGCYFGEQLEIWDGEGDCESQYLFERLGFQSLIMNSKAMLENFKEIMISLLRLSKNKTFIFTWDTINYDNPLIYDKEKLTNELGIWETLDDVYEQTSGNFGRKNDHHWSSRTDTKFGKYVIKLIENEN